MSEPAERYDRALSQLPTAHAVLLRMIDDGAPPDRIARVLGIEPEAIGPLSAIAQAKMQKVLNREH